MPADKKFDSPATPVASGSCSRTASCSCRSTSEPARRRLFGHRRRVRLRWPTLRYLRHGTELDLADERGLVEPSLVVFAGRYYLTLRNDARGYVTASDDGLHFGDLKPGRSTTASISAATTRSSTGSYTRRPVPGPTRDAAPTTITSLATGHRCSSRRSTRRSCR